MTTWFINRQADGDNTGVLDIPIPTISMHREVGRLTYRKQGFSFIIAFDARRRGLIITAGLDRVCSSH